VEKTLLTLNVIHKQLTFIFGEIVPTPLTIFHTHQKVGLHEPLEYK
jgi:hypothetical protein